MYNEEIKNKFLSSVDAGKDQYIRLFEEALKTESELSKDLYDFNVKEILSVFNKQEEFVLVSDYTDWATCQGYRASNINFAETFLVADDEDE